MDQFESTILSTPQKLPGDPQDFVFIDSVEKELENISHILEHSAQKGRYNIFKFIS